MASHKHLVALAVILAVAAVGVYATNLVVGRRMAGDSLACYGSVHLAAQAGRVVSATRICNTPNPRQYINYIEARDVGAVGRGGYAQVTSGGINQRTVSIYLWSQPGQPLNFNINVYGRIV